MSALTKSHARRSFFARAPEGALRLTAALLCWSSLTVCLPPLSRAEAQQNLWTFQKAEQQALERSPAVRRAVAARDTASAYQRYATTPRAGNPQVALRAMVGYPDQSAATYSLTLGIPFDVAGKRRAWRREAGSIIAEAEANLAAAKNDVRAEVRSAYVRVAMAHAARIVTGQSADTAQELLARVQARLDANATTALDLALSESQYAEALANLSRADRTLVDAQNAFREAMGLLFDAEVEVEPLPLPALPEGLTVNVAVERARLHRKETQAWASQEQRFRNSDSRLRAEAWAPVTAGLDAEAQANRNTQHTVGGSLGFEVPVIFRNQGARAVAKGEANAAGVSRELSEQSIDREASSSYRALEAALAELGAIETRALPAAERTLAMVHTMLDAGVVDYFRVLTARANAFALRSRRVEALREAWLARIALERAMGGWESAP